jgi:hypothetical protein
LKYVARGIQFVEETDILLYRERRKYFDALRRVWVGLESARAVLAKARQRIDEKQRQAREQKR